jgi:hypothetical protein
MPLTITIEEDKGVCYIWLKRTSDVQPPQEIILTTTDELKEARRLAHRLRQVLGYDDNQCAILIRRLKDGEAKDDGDKRWTNPRGG